MRILTAGPSHHDSGDISSPTHPQHDIITREKPKTREPRRYQVVLLNDDFTPMDFVVWLLQTIFNHTSEESRRLMLKIHHQGKAICGVYPFDIARTKAAQARSLAEQNQHPLQCEIEALENP